MTWCRPGNKPLSEPINVRLRTLRRPRDLLAEIFCHSFSGNNINSDRIAGILITLADKSISMILNVYLPTDLRSMTHVSQEYDEMCPDMLEMCINRYLYDKLVVGGDFNTDFSRKNAHPEYLNHFSEINSLVSVWQLSFLYRPLHYFSYTARFC